MSRDQNVNDSKSTIQLFEDEILIRGCTLSLQKIKSAYKELQSVAAKEADKIIPNLPKPDELTQDEFEKRNDFLREDAFRLTVSIIGFDRQTVYGETAEIFDSGDLPNPIKTIYFTNVTAYRRHANGTDPANNFSIWLNFDKPPLFDPSPLVSQPTVNTSKALINADDLVFYRAVQNIVHRKINENKKLYSVIHEKFSYDLGLWIFTLPYALYWLSILSEAIDRSGGKYSSFKVAIYIYGLGMALVFYRVLFGYIKWAYPLNVLEENKDRSLRHRIALGALISSIIITLVGSVVQRLSGL